MKKYERIIKITKIIDFLENIKIIKKNCIKLYKI